MQRPFDPATGAWLPAEPTATAPSGAAADGVRRGPLATVAHVVLGLDLGLLGLSTVVAALAAIQQAINPQPLAPVSPELLWANAIVTLLLMGAVPFGWFLATRLPPLAGTLAALRLHTPLPSLAKGVGLGLLSLGVLFAVGLAMERLGWIEPNPVADALFESVDWPLAIMLSVGAAVGEEIFFRGLLQRWLGVWGQAALFGLSHASYGTVLQLVVPAALGLLFGLLVKRGASLWLVIAAHFTFDFVQFAIGLAAKGAA